MYTAPVKSIIHAWMLTMLILAGALFIPVIARADSLTFDPASPTSYTGSNDPLIGTICAPPNAIVAFKSDQTATGFSGYAIPCDQTELFSHDYAISLAEFNDFAAGTVTFVEYDDSSADRLDCVGGGNLVDCTGSPAYAGYFAFYEMTGDTPTPSGISTTSPEALEAVSALAGLGIFSFISGFAITLWIFQRFLA